MASVVLALAAGMGWLYLLRRTGLFDAGPNLSGALPFEQLARADDQPLLRVAIAWLPAGATAGLALAWAADARRWVRALTVGATALVMLLMTGAAADAIAISSGDVVGRIPDQAAHAGLWVEVALAIMGSLPVARRSSSASPAARAAASPS
jgi:hypothetical protein